MVALISNGEDRNLDNLFFRFDLARPKVNALTEGPTVQKRLYM